jgi:hypothetical protein
LLSEIKQGSDQPDDILWIKKFRDYLHTMGQEKTIALLDFAITCQLLRVHEQEIKGLNHNWKRYHELHGERKQLLAHIYNNYFSEDCPTPIPLTNQVMREELCRCLAQSQTSGGQYDMNNDAYASIVNLIWQARTDYRVWKGGLETAYKQFIVYRPSANLTAVLLSII